MADGTESAQGAKAKSAREVATGAQAGGAQAVEARGAWSLPPSEVAPTLPTATAPAISSAQMAAAHAASLPLAYGYAPGNPYAYPGLGAPGRDTLKGLSRLKHATVAALLAAAATTAVGAFALYLYVDPRLGPSIFFVPPALGIQLVAYLLQVIAIFLGWSAFEEIADSAREINPEHDLAARRAVQFMYYAVAAWFIGGLAALSVSGAYLFDQVGLGPGVNPFTVATLSFFGALALTGVAINALLAVAMQGALGKLMRERGRNLRGLFLALALGGTFASVAVALYCLAVIHGPDLAPLLSCVSAASLGVYLVQIGEAEEGVRVLAATRGNDPDAPVPPPAAFAPPSA